MKQHLAIELIVVLGLSATALVAAQRGGSAPAPAAAQRPSLAQQVPEAIEVDPDRLQPVSVRRS